MPSSSALFWINKTAQSAHLSRSENQERIELFSQAQRASRKQKSKTRNKDQVILSAEKRHRHHIKTLNDVDCFYDEFGRPTILTQPEITGESFPPEPALNPHPSWTDAERRSVAFFFHLTVNNILSVQRDFWFWKEILPCLTEHHAAFRHLIVAIASTHELLYDRDEKVLNAFALIQCNKATRLLRSSQAWHPTLLLASCILLSAFSLLRGDHHSADMTIDSGLKMALSPADGSETGQNHEEQLQRILARIGKEFGYRLWNPSISYQFERSQAASGALLIETEGVKGPFTNPDQALQAYKNLVLDVVTKLLRNVARGAYIDPQCSLAQDTIRQLSKFTYYWECFYKQIPLQDESKRMQMKEVRIAFNIACLLFYTKIINPVEVPFDGHPGICDDTLQLAEEVVNARRIGLCGQYLDTNGSIFTLGLCSYSPVLRQRVAALLKDQADDEDGLLTWVPGKLVEIMISVQDQPLFKKAGYAELIITGLSCKDRPKTIRVEYQLIFAGRTLHAADFQVDEGSSASDRITASEIDQCLQDIMAAYTMYAKPHASVAPRGYIREMYYNGRPVPVLWESGGS